ANAPPSVTVPLERALKARDQLQARRQTWASHLLAGSELAGGQRLDEAVPRRVEALDRALSRAERTISSLRAKDAQRRQFLADHRPELDRLEAVRRAETARGSQVRAGAMVLAPS